MSDYEKQRMERIRQNRARMDALGLPSSLLTTTNANKETRRKKHKSEDDDEYMPSAVEQVTEDDDDTSSSEPDTEEEDQQLKDSRPPSRMPKGKKKILTAKKRVQVQKHKSNSGFDDEDEAFLQAIALSLQEKGFSQNEGCSGLSKISVSRLSNGKCSERKGNVRSQEESGTRKRKTQVSSRVQMTEDELVVHFFQFDDAGKGSINVEDVELMAATHDFTWTDKELSEMIHCFDSDEDGKLSLDDFRKIAGRCNML